jgi:hypothetical protein
MLGQRPERWFCYLDRNDYHAFLVLVEEEPARRAYALYREGRVLEAARALKEAAAVAYEVDEELWDRLYEAVPDMAWRATGVPLTVTRRCSTSAPESRPFFLRGEPYESKEDARGRYL